MLEEDPHNPTGIVTKEGYLCCCAKLMRESDNLDELLHCFKLFDKENKGMLSEQTLRYILSGLGDAFTDEEMDNFMKECANFIEVIGEVKYVDYVEFSKYIKDLEFKTKPKVDDGKGVKKDAKKKGK